MQFHLIALSVSVFSMADTVNDYCIAFHLEQDSIVADAQSVFGSDVGQPLHISAQVLVQRFGRGYYPVTFGS
jgi:hypothetical protein